MKQRYETLFENYGKKYDDESFTQGTNGECELNTRGRCTFPGWGGTGAAD